MPYRWPFQPPVVLSQAHLYILDGQAQSPHYLISVQVHLSILLKETTCHAVLIHTKRPDLNSTRQHSYSLGKDDEVYIMLNLQCQW